jgi:pimeloyl-ACP methyl ester carboxylesterase
MRKHLRWAAAVTGALVAVTSLPSAFAAVERPGHDAIVWGPCPPRAADAPVDPAQTCGTLTVPLDYRHPRGRTIDIAVSRVPASDPAKRRGILLLNPGGPGGEGLNLAGDFAQQAAPQVLAAYDRIGFDPRGVGHSSPVTCDLSAAEMLPNLPYPDRHGSIKDNVAFARSAADRCARHSGDLLPFITTANTARDMDRIRQALGEQKASYYGGSYGTYLGAVYASLFADRTDRVVLDSAVDPDQVWYDEFRGQSAGAAKRFPDAARYAAANAATIGFGHTAQEVTTAYLALAEHLDAKPVAIPGSPTVLDGNLLRFITFNLLYQDAAVPPLAQAWRGAADLADGTATVDDISLLTLILEKLTPSLGTSPGVPADNAVAAAYAVACGDARWPRDVKLYQRNVLADRRTFPLTGGAAANIWPCAFWKTAPAEQPVVVTKHGPRNVMILQNERDPATPLASAIGMRQALGGRAVLVSVDAGGHGVYGLQGNGSCADNAANAFLTGGNLPAGDVHCPAP